MIQWSDMTELEIIRKIAERSWKINMHSYGCHVMGRDVTPPMSFGDIEPPETRIEYGSCTCGWGELAQAINKVLAGPEQLMMDLKGPDGKAI